MQDWLDIQRALGNYLRSETVKKGFIKNGSTWFNNWQDWINYTEDTHASYGGTRTYGDDPFIARVKEAQGLRKASFEGPTGALLDRIRTHQTHENAPKKSHGSTDKSDGGDLV